MSKERRAYCKDWKLRKLYGITLEDHQKMVDEQGNRCKLCLVHHNETHGGLYVDHNHQTGKVRGLLCAKCNWAIGLLGEDTELAERAIGYLLKNN